ncbi:MAG: MFS transporter [Pseudoflavonifractor sp.]|nr:MFS transporter [Pseudoflavonifractor sp.]
MENKRGEPGLWTRGYILVFFMGIMMFSSNQICNSTTSLYVAALGGSASYSGTMFALFTASALITRLFIGNIIDRKGCRVIALTGSAFMIIFTALFNLVPRLPAIGIFRFFQGIGYASAGTAFSTAVSLIVPKQHTGRGISIYGLTQSIATSIGPFLGLTLISGNNFHYVYWSGSFMMVFAMIAIILCDFPVPRLVEAKPKAKVRRPFCEKISEFANEHLERKAFKPAIVQLINSIAVSSVVFYIPLFAVGRSYAMASIFFVVASVTMLFTRILLSRIMNKLSYTYILSASMLIGIIGFFFIALTQSRFLFLIAGACYGVTHGTSQPTLNTVSVAAVPPERRGAATATFFISVDAGMGIGSLLWGALIDRTTFTTIYLTAAGMLFLCIALLLLFSKKTQ